MWSYKRSLSPFSVTVVLGFAALLAVTAGCAPNITDLRNEGIDLYRDQRYFESMARMREVLQENPSDARANYYMGLNYRVLAERDFRAGDVAAANRQIDTAVMYYRQAIKSWPNYMAAISAKNEALEARGKYEQALQVAERATSLARGDFEHHLYLGHEFYQRGDFDNALREYKKALAINNKIPEGWAAIGKLYLEVGRTDLARDAYQHVFEIDPNYPGAAEALDLLAAEGGEFSSEPPVGNEP